MLKNYLVIDHKQTETTLNARLKKILAFHRVAF